jgi:hypothetical protein
MKRKLFFTLGTLAVIAIATVNVNIASSHSHSTKTSFLKKSVIERAFGGSFEFDGQTWNDTDSHSGGKWKPVIINCTGYTYNNQDQMIASWPGTMIQCQSGNGNCNSTVTYQCIGNPAY